jgi:uncharacterized protein YutE (UPF0331/DUF86 family)
MDRDVVTAKLESLRHCVERVRTRTPASVEELSSCYDAQDIICLNLERAVQACVDIAAHIVSDTECTVPDSMAGTFDALERQGVLSRDLTERMRRAVGFRNISVHAYQTLDWEIIYSIATERLGDFVEYGLAIEAVLTGAPGSEP